MIKLKDAINLYISRTCGGKSEGSTRNKKIHGKWFIDQLGEDLDCETFTVDQAMEIEQKILLSDKGEGWHFHKLVFIKAVFSYLVKTDKLVKSPFRHVKSVRLNNARTNYLSNEDELKIKEFMHYIDYRRVRFAILTGVRGKEMLDLRWSDVNLELGIMSFRKTKNKKTRHIPITEEIREILMAVKPYPGDDGRVFNGSARQMKYAFEQAVKKAGLIGITFHSLRHTCASRLVSMGTPLTVVKELLGHSDISMTGRYSHLQKDEIIKAMEKLSNYKAA